MTSRAHDTSTSARARPSNAYRIPQDGEVDVLVVPDPEFLSLLRNHLSLALAVLHRGFVKTPQTNADRFRFLRRLLSVINLCFLEPPNPDIFLDPTFQHVLHGIVSTASSYDVRPRDELGRDFVDSDSMRVDNISQATIFAALYLYDILNNCYHTVYDSGTVSESYRAHEVLFAERVQQFWAALVEHRTIFFRASILDYRMAFPDMEPIPLRILLAHCLLFSSSTMDSFLRKQEFNETAMKAYFLSWIYLAPDRALQIELSRQFNLHFSDLPASANTGWFQDLLVTSRQKADFIATYRCSLMSRSADDQVHARLLHLFDALCTLPQMRECVQLGGSSIQPIFWIIKTLQMALCMQAGSPCEPFIVLTGLSGMDDHQGSTLAGFRATRTLTREGTQPLRRVRVSRRVGPRVNPSEGMWRVWGGASLSV